MAEYESRYYAERAAELLRNAENSERHRSESIATYADYKSRLREAATAHALTALALAATEGSDE